IWVMNANGSGQHQIGFGANPEWSSVTGGPGKPRLKFSQRKLKRHSKCLAKFDSYNAAVKTKASKRTLFDMSIYVDGRLIDQVFSTNFLAEGADQLRRGRHKVKVVIVDAAFHDRIVRTFRIKRC